MLLLLAGPGSKLRDFWMRLESIQRVPVSPKVFLLRDQLVNGAMAFATQRNRFPHLLASEVLFKPLVAVTCPRNEMVFRRASLCLSMTKGTVGGFPGHLPALRMSQFVGIV